jgi:hypothetical protein
MVRVRAERCHGFTTLTFVLATALCGALGDKVGRIRGSISTGPRGAEELVEETASARGARIVAGCDLWTDRISRESSPSFRGGPLKRDTSTWLSVLMDRVSLSVCYRTDYVP